MDFVNQKKIIREDFLLKRDKLKENFTNENKNEDDVIDADYEEVDDDKKASGQ